MQTQLFRRLQAFLFLLSFTLGCVWVIPSVVLSEPTSAPLQVQVQESETPRPRDSSVNAVRRFQYRLRLPNQTASAASDTWITLQTVAAVPQNQPATATLSQPSNASSPSSEWLATTSTVGSATQNNADYRVAVVQGRVTGPVLTGEAAPVDAVVFSGQGLAAEWMRRMMRVGSEVQWDVGQQQLTVLWTPETYRQDVLAVLAQAKTRAATRANRVSTETPLLLKQEQAVQQCLLQLPDVAAGPRAFEVAADACRQRAMQAVYATLPPEPPDFRGVWLRPMQRSEKAIEAEVLRLKSAGVSHVFLEAYVQGYTLYPSAVMARYQLPEQHPRFRGTDPLQLWLDAAHRHGLQLHLWFQTFYAGNQAEVVEPYGPILSKYPQWRNVQRPNWQKETPVASKVEPGHFFLDPANPEVRRFLNELLTEAAERYPLDGIQLDYIRYPSTAKLTRSFFLDSTWGYSPVARQRFQAFLSNKNTASMAMASVATVLPAEALLESPPTAQTLAKGVVVAAKPASSTSLTAKPPAPVTDHPVTDPVRFRLTDPQWPVWQQWLKDQVTTFVCDLTPALKTKRPGLSVSAVVFPPSDPGFTQKLQVWPQWLNQGCVDSVSVIGLETEPSRLLTQLKQIQGLTNKPNQVYAGLFGPYHRTPILEWLNQVDAVSQAGVPGVVLFEWSRLMPDYEEALHQGVFKQYVFK
ncbi:MAG: family 10 glycosylhydrolase [Candidatus Melainabacteria bacterium]|nr:family 10 glycosylhydrolase [Candidatus Melainabacteria bacterium]